MMCKKVCAVKDILRNNYLLVVSMEAHIYISLKRSHFFCLLYLAAELEASINQNKC